MPEHHGDEDGNRRRGRRPLRGTRRWVLGSLLAAVAAGTARSGMAAHKPSHATEDIAIGDMFDIQFAINRLTQLSDVIDAARPDHPASERGSK